MRGILLVMVLSAVLGWIVSMCFGLYAISGNPLWCPIVVGAILWIIALLNPTALPIYKGYIPAIFPLVGLYAHGLGGFILGWIAVWFCQCMADTLRYKILSQFTGGAGPEEIIPLESVGILVPGTVFAVLFWTFGCPVWQQGSDFILNVARWTHYTFPTPPVGWKGTVDQFNLCHAVAAVGFMFAWFRQIGVSSMALLFASDKPVRI